eukprot:TRINITY_DN10762_c0_g2_i3.p1 TRINITY_DN10762_c0_g2~~TRINITY_DN10762_c0_g2_i3.p1  ORF type:complete len:160 (+),score=12.89 TRINITY_DN10762_c0_g2_i3:51-482(+)
MPKKASAKSTKGKKGKGKASKKLSRRKDTPQKPEQPSLKWPWQAATTAWLDHRLENRAKILREFRGHYLFGDGIVTSHDEWLQSVKLHTQPFASKQVESLVQVRVFELAMLSTVSRVLLALYAKVSDYATHAAPGYLDAVRGR